MSFSENSTLKWLPWQPWAKSAMALFLKMFASACSTCVPNFMLVSQNARLDPCIAMSRSTTVASGVIVSKCFWAFPRSSGRQAWREIPKHIWKQLYRMRVISKSYISSNTSLTIIIRVSFESLACQLSGGMNDFLIECLI